MALINKQTGARIRSSAEMPIRQKQLQDDWDRAAVVSPSISGLASSREITQKRTSDT